MDFQTNKRLASEVAIIPSKRLRNKIAGFTTHLMRRIQKGPVRGISFKLQEEERERKDNYVPEESALKLSGIEVDVDTKSMLRAINFGDLAGVKAVDASAAAIVRERPRRTERGDRPERSERRRV